MLVLCVDVGAVPEVGVKTVNSCCLGSVCRFCGWCRDWSRNCALFCVGSVCRCVGFPLEDGEKTGDTFSVGSLRRFGGCSRGWN